MIYDLLILGAGPAGYLAAERAGKEGLNVALVEKRNVGGVCLNEGCVPSKTLLYSAKIYDTIKKGDKYGIACSELLLNHEAVVARKNKVVNMLTSGIRAKLKKNKVALIEGVGVIKGKTLEGYEVDVDGKTFISKRILVATGSMPVVPPIPGVKEGMEAGYVMTNREILDIKQIPSSLVIIGGGVIGLEMASYFNSAGSSVTVIEMLDHIAGYTDREISDMLLKKYESKGIVFKLGCKVVEIKEGKVLYESAGNIEAATADKVLLSIGRRPVVQGLGLETLGVEIENGRIKTDERTMTNVPGVYAAGDVNGVSMLAHTAYREAEVCVNNILGKKDMVRYGTIPYVIYTNPEVAGIGETEESAMGKGIAFEKSVISMKYSGRFVAENEGEDGICKILADKNTRKLIGVHMLGNYSSEIIYGAAVMMENEMRVEDIKEIVFPHPTVSEIIREAIFEI